MRETRRAAGHRASHTDLLLDVRRVAWRPHVRPVDAVVVPSVRPARFLRSVIRAAADADVLLVVLCSKESTPSAIAAEVGRVAGASAVVVAMPPDLVDGRLDLHTSGPRFRDLAAGRDSDLSAKRNLGLVLARSCRWSKILFVDDDVAIRAADVRRTAAQLEQVPVAAFRLTRHPDNSVVGHARREVGDRQDVFVSGAALGVNVSDQPLPFFPDAYNEDWFAFAHLALAGELGWAGDLRQAPYDPFADPSRARQQEFGDALAEGLYARLARTGSPTGAADRGYWAAFLDARRAFLDRLLDRSARAGLRRQAAALRAAADQLALVGPDDCVAFVAAWCRDRVAWVDATQRLPAARNLAEALDRFGLTGRAASSARSASVASRRPAAGVTAGPS